MPRRAKLDLSIVTKVVLLPTKDKLNGLIKALKAFILSITIIGQYQGKGQAFKLAIRLNKNITLLGQGGQPYVLSHSS
jgi:hypothetical protein